jgi:hypothetical protein
VRLNSEQHQEVEESSEKTEVKSPDGRERTKEPG